jgi:hypothetical protein
VSIRGKRLSIHPLARKTGETPTRIKPDEHGQGLCIEWLYPRFLRQSAAEGFPSIRSPEKPEKSPTRIRADEHG